MRTAIAIHLVPEVREQLVRHARGRSVPKRILAKIAKCKEALGTLH